MFDRILVPLDGSPRAELVLDLLKPLLKRKDAEVLLLRSVQLPLVATDVDLGAVEAQARAEASKYVDEMTRRLEDEGILVRGRIAAGPPAESILDAADREKADLIAMTTHGRTGLARWALGSVAEKVTRSASVPVFLARSFRPDSAAVGQGRIRKILIPTDGSEGSRAVLRAAAEWARLFEAEMFVLYVSPGRGMPAGAYYGTMADPLGPAYLPPPTVEENERVAEKAAQSLAGKGLRVTSLTVSGDAAEQIVDTATSRGADLIAMATRGRSGLSRWVLGSVTEKVLRHSPVPLLVVRAVETRAEKAEPRRERRRKVAAGRGTRRGGRLRRS